MILAALLTGGAFFSCASHDDANVTRNAVPDAISVIDAAAAARMIAEDSDVVILDIRTPGEFARGHLEGAINIDYSADDYEQRLEALDKCKTYLMH